MKISRTRNALAGIITGLFSKLLHMGMPFITRTALLYILGTQYLGLNGLFSSLLSFLSMAELGVSNALVYSMYKPIAEGNEDEVCALLNLYRKLYRWIGTFILTAGLVCVPFLRVLISGDVPTDVNLYVLYALYLGNTVCSYFLFAYRGSLLTAHQRIDVTNVIDSTVSASVWAIQLLSLFLFRSYYAYVIFMPVSNIVGNFARLYYTRKLYPQYTPRDKVDPELEASIFKKIKALVGAKISTTVLHSSDNIVISAFLGLTMVTVYGNYYFLLNSIGGFLGIIYSSILPGIGNSLVAESREKNYRDFKKFSFINHWMVSWCAVCFLCLFQPFIKLWVGEELMLPFSVVVLIVLYFILYQGRKVVITYKDAAGLWWEDRFRPFVMAGTNLISNLILVQFIGIWGIIISTVLSLCVSVPWETWTVFKYVFKRSPREYAAMLLQFLLVTAVASAVTLGICQICSEGIPAILVRGCICVVVPNVIFFLAFRKREEFAEAKALVLRFLKR
jgi:O-antigen/teichoic acid export membrane protein